MKRREPTCSPVEGVLFETVTVGNVTTKLYRRERQTATGKRVVFELADYSTGTRRLRGFKLLSEARAKAREIASQLSSGKAVAAMLSNSDAASYGRGVELIRPTGATLETACDTYAKCFQILGGDRMLEVSRYFAEHRVGQIESKAVTDVVLEHIASRQARGKSPRYVADLRARLSKFAGAFGANPKTITAPDWRDAEGNDTRNRGVNISTITTPDVQRWLDGLKVAPQTARNFRGVLHTLFEFAESRGYIMSGGNPVKKTERVTVIGGGVEIFTVSEIAALPKSASPDFLPFIAIGAFAGLRSAEIERLEWRDVDMAGGFIHVTADKAKTRSRRLVPILPNLAAFLAPYAKCAGKVWKGRPNELQGARAATVKSAGVKWKANAIRHGFISYRLAEIQNAAQVALEAGNSPAVVFKHYWELVKPTDAKAWFAVAPEAPANIAT